MLFCYALLLVLYSSKKFWAWCVFLFSRYGTLEGSQDFEACGSVIAGESMQLCKSFFNLKIHNSDMLALLSILPIS